MSALSIVRNEDKAVILVANPLYLTSPFTAQWGGRVTFEILEADAGRLKDLIGTKQLYYLENELFWAQLESLEPCESTHPRSRKKTIVRGVFSIFGEATAIT